MRIRTAATCIAVAGMAAAPAAAELVYGMTEFNTLITFESGDPTNILSGFAVTGLSTGEEVRGIDLRPDTGELYALGSLDNLYTIDPSTGAATLVGSGFSPGLNGSSFGFDFNPTIDKIRAVSDADQNLVLDPDAGTSTGVTDLFYASGDANDGADPNIVGSAYTNSFAGASSTQLYGIDSGLDILVTQANSAGTLETVGSLGVDFTDVVGFDISGDSGIAYLAARDVSASLTAFWVVDLSTGVATRVDEIGGGALVTSIAVVPAPASVALLGLGVACAAGRRRG